MPNRTLPFRYRETGLSPVWVVSQSRQPKPCWQSTFPISFLASADDGCGFKGDCTGSFNVLINNQVDCLPMYSISWFQKAGRWSLVMRTIKCLKGVWWMPWYAQAMKDVIRCDKRRGAANKLWSGDFRMGKPTLETSNQTSLLVVLRLLVSLMSIYIWIHRV